MYIIKGKTEEWKVIKLMAALATQPCICLLTWFSKSTAGRTWWVSLKLGWHFLCKVKAFGSWSSKNLTPSATVGDIRGHDRGSWGSGGASLFGRPFSLHVDWLSWYLRELIAPSLRYHVCSNVFSSFILRVKTIGFVNTIFLLLGWGDRRKRRRNRLPLEQTLRSFSQESLDIQYGSNGCSDSWMPFWFSRSGYLIRIRRRSKASLESFWAFTRHLQVYQPSQSLSELIKQSKVPENS